MDYFFHKINFKYSSLELMDFNDDFILKDANLLLFGDDNDKPLTNLFSTMGI